MLVDKHMIDMLFVSKYELTKNMYRCRVFLIVGFYIWEQTFYAVYFYN